MTTNGTGRAFALEPLMAKYDVDVFLTGHEHNYERIWPIMNGTFVKSYDKTGGGPAQGKVAHVITGAGGAYLLIRTH